MTPALSSLLRSAALREPGLQLSAFNAEETAWLVQTGLGPLLFWATEPDAERQTAAVWPALAGSALTVEVLAAENFQAVAAIIARCRQRGVEVTLLKGIALAGRYPRPHLRLMRDVDVLVDEGRAGAAEQVLRELGYRPETDLPDSFFLDHHHSAPLHNPETGVWVEIHTGLVPKRSMLARDEAFSKETVRNETLPCRFGDLPARTLSDELQLVYLAGHWAEGFRHTGGLFPLLDLLIILEQSDGALDWDRVLRWTRGPGSAACLYLALGYLHGQGLAQPPPTVLRTLASQQRAFGRSGLALMHRLIEHYLARPFRPGRLINHHSITNTWQTLLAAPSPVRGYGRLAWNLAFPPGDVPRFSARYQWRRLRSLLRPRP